MGILLSLDRITSYIYQAKNIGYGRNKCLSRQIGAILVKDDSIISAGFNGPAKRIPHCEGEICPRRTLGYKSGEGLDHCYAAHAERNAIYLAAKNGINTNNASMFCWCSPPCKDCLIACIQAGIKNIFCLYGAFYEKASENIYNMQIINLYTYDSEENYWYKYRNQVMIRINPEDIKDLGKEL